MSFQHLLFADFVQFKNVPTQRCLEEVWIVVGGVQHSVIPRLGTLVHLVHQFKGGLVVFLDEIILVECSNPSPVQ